MICGKRWVLLSLAFEVLLFIPFLTACGGGRDGSARENTDGRTSTFPLHEHVRAALFYVGEEREKIPGLKVGSAWDNLWLWHYGGVDDPERRKNYAPEKFVPAENPFYVALPFNDLDENGEVKERAREIPWFDDQLLGRNGSVLKNRWLRITKGDRVAYAQWEDVGPFSEDDFDYVFGNAPPSNRVNEVGLLFSPAVRDYLGLESLDYVDWQFVNEEDVPPGPWKATVTTSPVTYLDFAEISPSTTWYWQLQGELRTDVPAQLYDVDLFDVPEEMVQQLKSSGKIVVCYFSAGTYEDWRPDAGEFNEEDLGKPLAGWEGERWLDIRSEDVRRVMLARLDLARDKGCDGVEPDNVDGYLHDTGFPLTYRDQFDYNRFLATEAKKRGLLVGLKNDLEQVPDLVCYFDFAVNESCHEFGECYMLGPFVQQGKPVFNAEYSDKYVKNPEEFRALCSDARKRNFRTVVFPRELDGSFAKSCDY